MSSLVIKTLSQPLIRLHHLGVALCNKVSGDYDHGPTANLLGFTSVPQSSIMLTRLLCQ